MAFFNSLQKLAWAKQRSQTLTTWESMRQDGLLTDLTILCGEKQFKVHRALVCASIPFVYKMHQTSQESVKDVIELKSVSPEALTIILDFIYKGVAAEIEDDIKGYEDILHATHLLQIEPLFEVYMSAFIELLNVKRFAKLLPIAELYECDKFAAMITFLVENFFHIVTTDDFLELSVYYLKELLSNPQLKEESVDLVVQAILSWVKFNEEERNDYLESLFSYVDVDKLSVAYLQVLTQDNSLIKNNQSVYTKLIAAVLAKLSFLPNSETQLICFGKYDGASVTSKFCLQKHTWSSLKTIDFNLDYGMAVAKYLEHFYFVGGGGWENAYVPSNSIYKYDPHSNLIVKLSNLLVAVNQAGVGILGGYLYVVGGRGVDNVVISTVQRVNPSNGNTVVVAPTTQLHNSPFVIPYRDHLYAVGSAAENWSCVERYSPTADDWSVISIVPEAIDWCQVTLLRNKLLVLCNKFDNQLHMFDMDAECWEMCNFEGAPADGVWGMWTAYCQSNELPVLLIRDASGLLYFRDVDVGEWVGSLNAIANPLHWPFCLTG